MVAILTVGSFWVAFISPTRSSGPLPTVWEWGVRAVAPLKSEVRAVLAATRPERSNTQPPPILMYHHIRDGQEGDSATTRGLSVSPESFRRQLQFLRLAGYRTISMADYASGHYEEKSLVLTFDDGYEDFYLAAWPLLRQFGFTATVYVIADKIDKPDFLTASQIKTLSGAGIEIGSHTATHPNLATAAPSSRQREIADSRRQLQLISGQPVESFCYPAGKYTEEVVAEVAATGYLTAVTTEPPGEEDIHHLKIPRHRIPNSLSLEGFMRLVQSK